MDKEELEQTLCVIMKKGSCWIFHRNEYGWYICKQRKYEYRLFWGELGKYKPVWIGRKIEPKGCNLGGWYSCEKEIGADYVWLPPSGEYRFV